MKQIIEKLDEINFQITQKIRAIRQSDELSETQIHELKNQVLALLEKAVELDVSSKLPAQELIEEPSEVTEPEIVEVEEAPTVSEETETPVEETQEATEQESNEEASTEDYAAALEDEINQTIQTHTSKPSIGDQINQNNDNSLADRFRKKKLNHLKDAMGINEKFLFTNELFNGSTELFIKEIEVLNDQDSYREAQVYFQKLESEHDWKKDSKATKLLKELMERRYL